MSYQKLYVHSWKVRQKSYKNLQMFFLIFFPRKSARNLDWPKCSNLGSNRKFSVKKPKNHFYLLSNDRHHEKYFSTENILSKACQFYTQKSPKRGPLGIIKVVIILNLSLINKFCKIFCFCIFVPENTPFWVKYKKNWAIFNSFWS